MKRAALLEQILSARSSIEAFTLMKEFDRTLKKQEEEEGVLAAMRTKSESELVRESKDRTGRFEPERGDGIGAFDSSDGHHARFVRHKHEEEEHDPPLWSYPHRFSGEEDDDDVVDDGEADQLRASLHEDWRDCHPKSFDHVDLGEVFPATLKEAAGIKVAAKPSTMLHFDRDFDSRCQSWLEVASEASVQQLAHALGFAAYSYENLDALKEWVGGKLAQFCTVAQGYCGDHGTGP